jgi:hypothetical protein
MLRNAEPNAGISALVPVGKGHQFVLYGDACSGVAGALHERTFSAVNAVVRRLTPAPEFIVFTGDHILGLTADPELLRVQWRHWLQREMAWIDQTKIPIWHTTGNHTTYDTQSERIFAEMLGHLPRNGPPGQEVLSYWVRRDDLLIVFVNTLWSGLGGEGHVESDWMQKVLWQHADARYKLVVGHHPVYPVNGFAGAYQRQVGPEHAQPFWDVLVAEGVLAYICSHILAYDSQVHRGVLQICTAGAGTAYLMPDEVEYHHCVQAVLDVEGLRCQVLDIAGAVRERLRWPVRLPPVSTWLSLPPGRSPALFSGGPFSDCLVAFRFVGIAPRPETGAEATFICTFDPGSVAPVWIGLRGPEQVLTVILAPEAGRSPHYWWGPGLTPGVPFELHLLLHTGMGPGGVMLRTHEDASWTSLSAASAWGADRIVWPDRWSVGHGPRGEADRPFAGDNFQVAAVIIGPSRAE